MGYPGPKRKGEAGKERGHFLPCFGMRSTQQSCKISWEPGSATLLWASCQKCLAGPHWNGSLSWVRRRDGDGGMVRAPVFRQEVSTPSNCATKGKL